MTTEERQERADDKAFDRNERSAERDYDRQWHLDKKVPLAMIITIVLGGLVHTGTFVWAASNLWTRVGDLEKSRDAAIPQFERIVRLEGKVDSVTTGMQEIKNLIIRLPGDRDRR